MRCDVIDHLMRFFLIFMRHGTMFGSKKNQIVKFCGGAKQRLAHVFHLLLSRNADRHNYLAGRVSRIGCP